jgi:hypothetical protein
MPPSTSKVMTLQLSPVAVWTVRKTALRLNALQATPVRNAEAVDRKFLNQPR